MQAHFAETGRLGLPWPAACSACPSIEEATPNQESALHLGAIWTTIAQMATFVWPVSAT